MVLRSACGACMCQNHVGGCEPGFTCMTDQGFVSEDGPYCVHESVLSSSASGASVRSADVAPGNTQRSVAGTDVSVDPGKIIMFVETQLTTRLDSTQLSLDTGLFQKF